MVQHAWGCFNLEQIKIHSNFFKECVTNNYLLAVGVYILIYSFMIAVGIPSIAPFTLLAGFLFGVVVGLLVAMTAAVLGSLLSFFVMRYLLKRFVRNRYANLLERFNTQMHHYGVSYLLMLHYSSVIPFFVINTLAALADLPLTTFIWTTIVGSAPLMLIYAVTGEQLSTIRSVGDIFSPTIILLLLLLIVLSVLPVLIKKVLHIRNP